MQNTSLNILYDISSFKHKAKEQEKADQSEENSIIQLQFITSQFNALISADQKL